MAITSSEISQFLNSQSATLIGQQQYAQSMANLYGAPQPQSRPANPFTQGAANTSGALAGVAAQLPDTALSVASTAAMFGYAPRVLDPFSMSMHAGAMGWRAGGLASAVLPAAATMGGYMAAGAAFDWASTQVQTGAQQQGMLLGGLSQAFPNQNLRSLMPIAGQVNTMAGSGIASMPELTTLMGQGIMSGDLRTSSLMGFQDQFRKLVSEVRTVSSILNSSLNEAYEAVQSLKASGISSADVPGVAMSMRGLGHAARMSPAETLMTVQAGAQLGRQAGIPIGMAAQGALSTAALYRFAQNENDNPLGLGSESLGQYQGAAYRFLGSAPGSRVLAAMMGRSGGLNQDVAAQIASGALSRGDINRLASRNLAGGGRDEFNSSSSELAAEFVSQYGPQGIMPSLSAMLAGRANPDTLRSQLTGLNRADLSRLGAMSATAPNMRQQMLAAASEGFEQGTRSTSLLDAVGMSVEMMLAPVKEKFRSFGREITNYASGIVEDVAGRFVSKSPSRGDPFVFNAWRQASASGNMAAMQRIESAAGMFAGRGGSATGGSFGDTVAGMTPRWMRAMAEGVSPLDMPAYGWSTGGTGAGDLAADVGMLGAGMTVSTRTGTSTVLGMAGRGLQGAGGWLTGTQAGVASTGFMGLGGYGTAAGGARMLGGLGQLGGLGIRAAGRLAGPVGAVMLANDIKDLGIQGAANAGLIEQPDSILGSQADLWQALGAAGSVRLERRTSLDAAGVIGGYSPVGGTGRGGVGTDETASQLYVGPQQRAQMEAFMKQAPSLAYSAREKMRRLSARDKDKLNERLSAAGTTGAGRQAAAYQVLSTVGATQEEAAAYLLSEGYLQSTLTGSKGDVEGVQEKLGKLGSGLASDLSQAVGFGIGKEYFRLAATGGLTKESLGSFLQGQGMGDRAARERVSRFLMNTGNSMGGTVHGWSGSEAVGSVSAGDILAVSGAAESADAFRTQQSAGQAQDDKANQAGEQAMRWAMRSAGLDDSSFSDAMGPGAGDKDYRAAFGRMLGGGMTAERLASLSRGMSGINSPAAAAFASMAAGSARFVSLNERFKSSGGKGAAPRRMLEEALGVDLHGFKGIDRYLRGESGPDATLSVEARERMVGAASQFFPGGNGSQAEQLVSNMLSDLRHNKGQFSAATLQSAAPPPSARPQAPQGKMDAQMQTLGQTIDTLNTKLKALADNSVFKLLS